MGAALLRCALIVAALIVVAWLVVGLRATELEAGAADTADKAQRGEVSSDEIVLARSSLQSARRLSADNGSLILEGLLMARTEQPEQGVLLAARTVEDEPDNLDGWRLLYLLLEDTDKRRADQALSKIRALDPLVAQELSER